MLKNMSKFKYPITIVGLMLYCLLMVQCDSKEYRKDKAEDLIKKESLTKIAEIADPESYKLVSMELDTIAETWIAVPGIIDLAEEYQEALKSQEFAVLYLEDLKETYKKELDRMVEQVFLGANIWDVARANQNCVTEKDIQKAETELSDYNKQLSDVRVRLSEKLKLATDNFVGWHATHKFRVKDNIGVAKLFVKHYYITPDFDQIILEWDEGSDRIPSMLSLISSEKSDIANIANKTASGVMGEAVLSNGKKLSFKSDYTIPEMTGATWKKVDGAIVIHCTQGTPYRSLIDGYMYVGEYKDGECWNEKWNDRMGYMEDIPYTPNPSKGDKLKSFEWYY